jgi:hypothetical protein
MRGDGTVDAPLSEGSTALMSSSMRLLSAGVTASAADSVLQREAEGMRRKLDALHHAGDLSDSPRSINAHDTCARTLNKQPECVRPKMPCRASTPCQPYTVLLCNAASATLGHRRSASLRRR